MPEDGTAVDLGCGTGILAVSIARSRPGMRVLATDRSWAACESARETARLAGLGERIDVRREDAGSGIPDESVDLVLCNPPFHDRHEVLERMSDALFGQAARMLRPGGAMVTVYNSHLRHRQALERLVGPTSQLARTPKFTVVLTRRR